MTHEGLTPRDAINYSIRRMPEATDNPRGGPVPTRPVSKETPPVETAILPKVPIEETQVNRILSEIKENEERNGKAQEFLGRELSDKERDAILSAHKVGEGEDGKNGGRAEI